MSSLLSGESLENKGVSSRPVRAYICQLQLTTNSDKLSDFCLPHASVRHPLLQPEPTPGSGSAKRWQPRTPAMAAGLTDHVWTLREVLLFRVPPWPQPAGM
jgi:hypothetical protein